MSASSDYSDSGAPLSDDAEASDEARGESIAVVVGHGAAGQRLDRFLAGRLAEPLAGVSRTRIQRWIAIGAVQVDGQLRMASHRLTGLERIEVWPQPLDSEQAFAPDPVALDVVYRDRDLLVIDKPAGLVTHPAPGHWRGTLMNGLLHADPAAAALPRAGIVHRLDRDTSGLLVCARSERAFVALTAQLASRAMGRRYLAIVTGDLTGQGVIDAPIGRDPRHRIRMAVVPGGKPARTTWRSLARRADGRHSALLLQLDTGRTHQIRVHMAHHGHPLVGDVLYGGHPVHGFTRQALHAWRLRLRHPADGRLCTFDAPLPEDMAQLAAALELPVAAIAPADEEAGR